ncbi:MFS transporter [soil metagenome]
MNQDSPPAAAEGHVSGPVLQRPWSYVPTMALFQSLTYCVISILPGLFLKSLGASNEMVGLASLFALPIAFRFLTGIVIDRRGSMRGWSIGTQIMSTATAVAGAISVLNEKPLWVTLSLFALAGVIAAFQDVSTDGFFLFAIRSDQKAFYANFKLQIYRVGVVIVQGFYVMLAGRYIVERRAPTEAWGRVFLLHAAVLLVLLLWNMVSFPKRVRSDEDRSRETTTFRWFGRLILDFVKTPGMGWTLAFIVFFRVAESVLSAMKVPFLLDPVTSGGLGLDLKDVGFLNGVVVFGISLLGGVAGGFWVQRVGLKRTLIPAVLLLSLPNAIFCYLSLHPPQAMGSLLGMHVHPTVLFCMVVESLANSVALAPEVYLLILCAQGPHRATLFAFVSGVVNLGWVLPGTFSGYLQHAMGYPALFLALTLVGLPVLLLVRRLPIDEMVLRDQAAG